MRRLAGGIPRAFKSHRTPEGAAYGAYCRDTLARLGELPPSAKPTLKAAGLVVIELDRLATDLNAARTLNRQRDQSRIRRQMKSFGAQLVRLEERLETLAAAHAPAGFARLNSDAGGRR